MELSQLRQHYHEQICEHIIYLGSTNIPNMADKSNAASCAIAAATFHRLNCTSTRPDSISPQAAGTLFEKINRVFLESAFQLIQHLRPGKWVFDITGNISQFQQYKHLADLERILKTNPDLKSYFGSDYLITPDVVVARYPVGDDEINRYQTILTSESDIASQTPLREANHKQLTPILHANISVKWTLRSDRAQNARTESLNLVRNRKGHTPRIVAVTAEPMPSRIASLALGTGDMDCVYHFALPELRASVHELAYSDSIELLETLIAGDRLRDISDLPFDLAI